MKISEILAEEASRFETFFGHRPDRAYLGSDQCQEIDDAIGELKKYGIFSTSANLSSRPVFNGMEIYRVDAKSYLACGVSQPSPCG